MPITIPAMAPPESLCDDAAREGVDERLLVVVVVGMDDPSAKVEETPEVDDTPEVEGTTATPSANPSYGEANAWAPEVVAVKIELAFRAELSKKETEIGTLYMLV